MSFHTLIASDIDGTLIPEETTIIPEAVYAQVRTAREKGFLFMAASGRQCREGTPFHHIYGVGKRYYQRVLDAVRAKGIDLDRYPDVDILEYIYDMPAVMDAADVMLSRAGASTISEITATARPSILVPSPNVTANHQEKNARVLSDKGAAVLMLEKDAGGDRLYDTVQRLLAAPAEPEKMQKALREMAIGDANERIYETLCALVKQK